MLKEGNRVVSREGSPNWLSNVSCSALKSHRYKQHSRASADCMCVCMCVCIYLWICNKNNRKRLNLKGSKGKDIEGREGRKWKGKMTYFCFNSKKQQKKLSRRTKLEGEPSPRSYRLRVWSAVFRTIEDVCGWEEGGFGKNSDGDR